MVANKTADVVASSDSSAAASSSGLDRIPMDVWARCAILVVGGFISMFTATVVNTAMPALESAFGVQIAVVQWVATAFLLGLAASIPGSGWAASRFGVTNLWLASLAAFTVLSIACALARSATALIVLRLAQGLAGGLLVPSSQMLLGIIAGPKRMGRVMSVLGVPIVLAPVLGLTVGGLMVARFGWTSLFWMNVPFGVIGLVMGFLWLPRAAGKPVSRFDALGFLLLTFGVPLFTWGVSNVTSGIAAGTHGLALSCAAVGLGLLAAFVGHATRISAPLLNVTLFSRPVFASACLIVFTAGFLTFGAQIVLPFYYLFVRGDGAAAAGLAVLPQAIGIALSLPMGGWLTDRFGGGIVTIVGIALTVVGTIGLALVTAVEPVWWMATVLIVRGFGLSMLSMPAYTSALAAVNREEVPDAIPIMTVLNRVGGAVGTALLAAAFQFGAGGSPSNPQSALAGFAFVHWVMVGLLLLTLLPTLRLLRSERVGLGRQP